jgi:hypothetical protein
MGAIRRKTHTSINASEEAIATVAFIKLLHADGNQEQCFLLGRAKVAPKSKIQAIPILMHRTSF